MSTESPKFEKTIEDSIEAQELTPEQKRILGEVWAKMIIDGANIPENIEEMDEEDIKSWLHQSLSRDMENLAAEWGLNPDAKSLTEMGGKEDLGEKAKLELEYIRNALVQVDGISEIIQGPEKSEAKSDKWDSWPKKMRGNKDFNCVGATLLGKHLLEKAGIKSFISNPVGHVLNVVKLSNNEWWYVDFRNNQLIKIDPEELVLAGMPTLQINHPGIDFHLLPLLEDPEEPELIIDNLACLKDEAEDPGIPDEYVEKREAKEFLERHKAEFEKADFSFLHRALYPKSVEVDSTKEMEEERSRIDNIRSCERPAQEYLKTLSKDRVMAIVREVGINRERVENLFYNGGESVLEGISPELKKVLELLMEGLKKIKEEQPETYKALADGIMRKLISFADES